MYFIFYQDSIDQWRWALYAMNHKKVADSAEGYWDRDDALRGIGLVMSTNTDTPMLQR